MNISIVTCLFVLDNKENENKKKNDIKKIKILVKKDDHSLVRTCMDESKSIKSISRDMVKAIIGTDKFHLEQVYTFGESRFFDDGKIDVIYMGLINRSLIKKIDDNYELVDLEIIGNKKLVFGEDEYSYKTEKKVTAGSLEYTHKIKVDDIKLEKELLEILITYKHLRFRMDSTDICFKLLPDIFTLEDVRIVYELVKDVSVDKSNFRKKIVKYCEKVDMIEDNKGYRPSQKYKFNPDTVDDWV